MTYVNLTREGEKKLRLELKELKEVKRPIVLESLQEARRKGDLSENAEYDAAKEEKAFLESRIQQVETMIRTARIVDNLSIDTDKAYIGARVELVDLDSDDPLHYILVDEIEADFAQRKISTKSPIGQALLGKGVDDEVEVTIPRGTLRYRITSISR